MSEISVPIQLIPERMRAAALCVKDLLERPENQALVARIRSKLRCEDRDALPLFLSSCFYVSTGPPHGSLSTQIKVILGYDSWKGYWEIVWAVHDELCRSPADHLHELSHGSQQDLWGLLGQLSDENLALGVIDKALEQRELPRACIRSEPEEWRPSPTFGFRSDNDF